MQIPNNLDIIALKYSGQIQFTHSIVFIQHSFRNQPKVSMRVMLRSDERNERKEARVKDRQKISSRRQRICQNALILYSAVAENGFISAFGARERNTRQWNSEHYSIIQMYVYVCVLEQTSNPVHFLHNVTPFFFFNPFRPYLSRPCV